MGSDGVGTTKSSTFLIPDTSQTRAVQSSLSGVWKSNRNYQNRFLNLGINATTVKQEPERKKLKCMTQASSRLSKGKWMNDNGGGESGVKGGT
jgi:hypothetical protein